jgi:hypothetical protein
MCHSCSSWLSNAPIIRRHSWQPPQVGGPVIDSASTQIAVEQNVGAHREDAVSGPQALRDPLIRG